MSSLNNLFNRVQMLDEAKVSPVGKQAPVFKDVPKQMKAAGLAASSRDAMIFITQVLSRLDIISPEVYEMTIKGQHKERMEKLMTILRSKEDEINAKSDEIVEYINQNLDNYTAGAGSDRSRTDKYKETAKEISQEVQNIKAGKEADDALRDIAVTVAKGLDSEVTDAEVDALDFDEADIHLNISDQELKKEVAGKIAAQLNANGYTAGVSGVGVNVEAPVGTFGSSADVDAMETAQDQLKGLVMSVEPSIGENDIVVKITTQEGTVSHEDAEAAVEDYEMEDAEGNHDDGDDVDEKCDYVPCEDGEAGTASITELGLNKAMIRSMTEDGDGSYDGTVGSLKQLVADKLSERPDIGLRGRLQHMLKQLDGQNDAAILSENVITESKNITGDSLLDIYASVKPIVETIVESTTVNENGQTTPTQQYLVEKAEAAIEEAYTNQYLTEQKASDSLLVTKEEKSESFKERYQPKTSYQLEELRRYGL